MFGLGWQEILVVLLLFLFLFGAKKLPQIGEGLGKTVREIRKIREERKGDREKPPKDEKGKSEGGDLASDLKKEVEEFPGVKEIKEIKQAADKVRNLTKILK
jgi:sec-independent protein translocase protein TatA